MKHDVINECWIYRGYKDKDGYGIFGRTGERKAHRIAYREANKDTFDKSLCVLHTCDVRACINPDHLYQGTPADNARDAKERGRLLGPRKVSLEIIDDMRGLHKLGWTQQKIADFYGVSNQSVSNYVRGEA